MAPPGYLLTVYFNFPFNFCGKPCLNMRQGHLFILFISISLYLYLYILSYLYLYLFIFICLYIYIFISISIYFFFNIFKFGDIRKH